MEKEIFESKFVRIFFDQETKIYTSKYLPETENMTDKEWQALMVELVKVVEKYKPRYILDDNRDKRYDYPPDIQEWTLKLFVNSWNKIGLEKYVQILPRHIIGQISSEQIQELSNTKFSTQFKNKFVADYESAIFWINESKTN